MSTLIELRRVTKSYVEGGRAGEGTHAASIHHVVLDEVDHRFAAGEIFLDQKMMGLFSLLFGTGIVLFVERADAKGRQPVALSLWRNGW